jgi:hypothetical protein
MGQNPELRPELDAILADAYSDALLIAERETGLLETTFPACCQCSYEQIVVPELRAEAG